MGQQEQPALVVPVVFFLSRIREFKNFSFVMMTTAGRSKELKE